jgi:hypothetical protein
MYAATGIRHGNKCDVWQLLRVERLTIDARAVRSH